MSTDFHKFNHDLLLDEASQNLARDTYPEIFFLLFDEYLIGKFAPIDRRANSRKRKAQTYGLLAILLAVTSLLGSAVAPILHAHGNKLLETTIIVISVATGLLAVTLGCSSILYGSAKRKWIYDRLKTEKLRQLHFQRFFLNITDTLKALKGQKTIDDYFRERNSWTDQVSQRINKVADSEIMQITATDGHIEPWLPKSISQNVVDARNEAVRSLEKLNSDQKRQIYDAYLHLRLRHQADYALHKLAGHGEIVGRLTLLKMAASVAFVIAILVHVLILFAVFNFPKHIESLHVVALSAFVVAVGAEKLIEGLGLNSSRIRYKEYAAKMSSLMNRFIDSCQMNETDEIVGIMIDTERAAFEEMREFVRTYDESSFVM